VRTARALPVPGRLTLDTLEGRRARYISPIRLYLTASVIYFLIAAVAPPLTARPTQLPGSDVQVDMMDAEAMQALTPEQRATIERSISRAPGPLKPLLETLYRDPAAFRRRVLETLPRVMFVLVPAFAGLLALFYRRRPFTVHLIFALHLHAFLFLAMTIPQLSNLTRNPRIAQAAGLMVGAAIVAYALAAMRRVYRDGWPKVVIKAIGLTASYAVLFLAGFLAALAWIVRFQ
jgi:hypothetical protein